MAEDVCRAQRRDDRNYCAGSSSSRSSAGEEQSNHECAKRVVRSGGAWCLQHAAFDRQHAVLLSSLQDVQVFERAAGVKDDDGLVRFDEAVAQEHAERVQRRVAFRAALMPS